MAGQMTILEMVNRWGAVMLGQQGGSKDKAPSTSHADVFVGMLSAVGPIDPETPPTYAGAQLASISDDSRSTLVANDLARVLNRT